MTKVLVGLEETLDKMIADYERDVTCDEEVVRSLESPQALASLRLSRACLGTAKLCRAFMVEVDLDEIRQQAFKSPPTMREGYLNAIDYLRNRIKEGR